MSIFEDICHCPRDNFTQDGISEFKSAFCTFYEYCYTIPIYVGSFREYLLSI